MQRDTPSIGSPPDPPGSRLPNFIVIGAMKSSTTAFYELLVRHPAVWFSADKEPHYFTSPSYGEAEAWRAYLRLFAEADESKTVLAEASTGYSKLPHLGPTPQRIKADLGDPKLLYLIRDPVARTISNYRHSYTIGAYQRGTRLRDAIEADPIIVQASRYAQQVHAYHEVFGEERLLVVTSDELQADPASVMRRVEAHLKIPPYDGWPSQLARTNSASDLSRSARLGKAGRSRLVGSIKALLPERVKREVKGMIPASQPPPEIEASEADLVFELVREDLQALVDILGDRIASWPSVARLKAR